MSTDLEGWGHCQSSGNKKLSREVKSELYKKRSVVLRSNNNNNNNNNVLLLQPEFGSMLILFFSEILKISGKAIRELNNGLD
jgi:hypothetical protein